MSILHRRPTVSKPVAHDPLICGIDPASDCPECRAAERHWLERQRSRERANHRRQIITRLAATIGCNVDDLVDAFGAIARHAQRGGRA
jgi:hypothetical protein